MTSVVKKHIFKKVYESAFSKTNLATLEQVTSQIVFPRSHSENTEFQLNLPLFLISENDRELHSVNLHQIPITTDNVILSTRILDSENLRLEVDRKTFIKDILDSDPVQITFKPPPKKAVVEFSSPNVAKPFHAGHLRSTIIGNFVANIKQKLGHDVYRINYLGDWGTQFGFLKLGVDRLQDADRKLAEKPIKTLYEAYVSANREAETNPNLHDLAREEFVKLEKGDEESLKAWAKFRNLSTEDLQRTYARLGVIFDEYQWESQFGRKEIDSVLERLQEQGLLRTDEKRRECAWTRGRPVPLLRSDGATLYIARDVAAALHRQRQTSFQEMLYVVENGQADHFQSLFSICKDLGLDHSWNLCHVKFGRIHGMSTRKGRVVFLEDILDDARDLVLERLKNSKTTKVEPTLELADALGSAAVVVNDLKQRRIKDYEFSLEKALQVAGDTAVRLQYTHCRLCSLLSNSAYSPAKDCDPDAIAEPEAVALALEIARFEEVVLRAHSELEACTLVVYLFHLTHAANKAFKVLPVKDSGGHVGSQRLLLFESCRKVLSEGLQLLGIVPLERM